MKALGRGAYNLIYVWRGFLIVMCGIYVGGRESRLWVTLLVGVLWFGRGVSFIEIEIFFFL